jgi:hypothetical protein
VSEYFKYGKDLRDLRTSWCRVTIQTCNREVPLSNLSKDTDYSEDFHCFPQSLL